MNRLKCVWICTPTVEIMAFLPTAALITNNVDNYLPCYHNQHLYLDMELVLSELWAKNSIQPEPQSME